jgi:inorganic pyrophosphatase
MELTVANIIQIGILLVGLGVTYGVLNQKIIGLMSTKQGCDKRFEIIEREHDATNQQIRDEIKQISGALNQLIGKIDVFFALYKHNEKEHTDGH